MSSIRSVLLASVVLLSSVSSIGAVQTPPDGTKQTYAECVEDCFKTYVAELADCDDDCKKCVQWVWVICVSSVLDMSCLNKCQKSAKTDFDACVKACAG
ncbi:hypothetical protein [Engelhardtia mirabilis]|uniref:Uncharacterized protein n=1 Tax=Engelhardtia mirabilis TaxID=2528011 RepID=A0A518BM09_9BACT|nr:hypothetical protein Pla133_30780 [Planctomycetes bacterium Pla133]QDV02313.1 hypothetical protein Pla86_30770 [Planctomycetes bacterium Pla86]